MKDAFTKAISGAVQHQIELESTIRCLLRDRASQDAPCSDIEAVQGMLNQLNTQVSALAKHLVTRYNQKVEDGPPSSSRTLRLPE